VVPDRVSILSFLCLTRIAYEITGILMVEEDKARKVRAILAGMWAGLVTDVRHKSLDDCWASARLTS